MSRDEKEICLYCRWWKPLYYLAPGDEAHRSSPGECRVASPVLMQWGSLSVGLESKTSWPRTNGGDFCGEFTSHRDDHPKSFDSWTTLGDAAKGIVGKISE